MRFRNGSWLVAVAVPVPRDCVQAPFEYMPGAVAWSVSDVQVPSFASLNSATTLLSAKAEGAAAMPRPSTAAQLASRPATRPLALRLDFANSDATTHLPVATFQMIR